MVLMAAVRSTDRIEAVRAVLDHDENACITEKVLCTAASNIHAGAEVLQWLLNFDKRLEVTEVVLKAAVANRFVGDAVMELVLSRTANISVGEATLKELLRNDERGAQVFERLISFGKVAHLTEVILLAVAPNIDTKVLEVLLRHHGDAFITEEILCAAASNKNQQVMEMLLKYDRHAVASEPVLLAAASNMNHKVLDVLLNHDRHAVVNELLLCEAASNQNHKVMEVLLNHDREVMVTTPVLLAIVYKGYNHDPKEVVEVILKHRAPNLTEDLLISIVSRSGIECIGLIMILLWQMKNVSITKRVISAIYSLALSNADEQSDSMSANETELVSTQDIVVQAAMLGRFEYDLIALTTLLDIDKEVQLTPDGVRVLFLGFEAVPLELEVVIKVLHRHERKIPISSNVALRYCYEEIRYDEVRMWFDQRQLEFDKAMFERLGDTQTQAATDRLIKAEISRREAERLQRQAEDLLLYDDESGEEL